MSWSDQVIAAHERNISNSGEGRALLIQCWKQFCEHQTAEPAIDLAHHLISDGNANEVELGFHVLNALGLGDTSL